MLQLIVKTRKTKPTSTITHLNFKGHNCRGFQDSYSNQTRKADFETHNSHGFISVRNNALNFKILTRGVANIKNP